MFFLCLQNHTAYWAKIGNKCAIVAWFHEKIGNKCEKKKTYENSCKIEISVCRINFLWVASFKKFPKSIEVYGFYSHTYLFLIKRKAKISQK